MNERIVWQKDICEEKMNFEEAKKYCSNLNEDGHNNWRLPTIKEFEAKIEQDMLLDNYWSSDFSKKYPEHVWIRNFEDDKVYYGYMLYEYNVCAVRDERSK